MGKILGIDLGSNSTGWAIRNTDLEGNQIEGFGVIIFEKGVASEKGNEYPKVQKRTESRGKKRNYQAEKYRKFGILQFLIEKNMCPLSIEDFNNWKTYIKGKKREYPQSEKFLNWIRFDFDGDGKPDFHLFGKDKVESYYVFRTFASNPDYKNVFYENPQILGRVFYQLVQRRGFKGRDEEEAKTMLTEGKPSVEKIYASTNNEDDLLQNIASLNQYSEHPLAQAVVNYAKTKSISLIEVKDFENVTGKGVTGKVTNRKVAVGNKKLMEQVKATISDDLENKIIAEQKLGKTVSYIAVDGATVGFVSITDAIKTSSAAAIKELMLQGVEVIMLTGDNVNTAKAVADELGLSSYKAGCLPEDKLNEIKRLQAEGKIVAMAGDGINDAPALAQANIGIAMGTGTDVAIESAKITLVKGDLLGIVKAKNLSHAVMKNIKQNLFFAFFYNVLGVPIAAGILYPFFGILLSPMIAALAMSMSSVSVIVNALRLRSFKL